MGLHERYGEILSSACGSVSLSLKEDDERRVRRAFERMMRRMHESESGSELRVEFLEDDEVQGFIREQQGVLTGALEEVEMSEGMRRRLNRSHYVFSGMKTFHELKEAFPELTRSDGSRKSFREFLDDVRKVDETYNGSWLRAEYNFAHMSGQMAARWEASEKHGERYLLQYRTQGDDKVRAEHAALDGVTLEKGDEFWDYYLPPNGWGCRCTVVEVLREQYVKTPHDEAMELGVEATRNDRRNMFRWNSGKKGRTFPDYNPYTTSRCRDCDMTGKLAAGGGVAENELCAACRLLRKCAAGERVSDVVNARDDWKEFRELKREARLELGRRGVFSDRGRNYYTHRMVMDKEARRAVAHHLFDKEEVDAFRQLRSLLPSIGNGKYVPIDMSRANYKEKMRRWGVLHFVRYDIEIGGVGFVLKTEVTRDRGNRNFVIERPYSLKKKKEGQNL